MRAPVILAALAVLLSHAAGAAETPPIVYRHASLIDGTGGPLRAGMAVIVRGERIAVVEPDAALTQAELAGARQVDLKGKYLLPGLIDSHEHMATPPNARRAEATLRRDLYGGVTAVRDMADDLRSVGELTRASLLGEIPAPDIYYAALMAGPSFFADPRTHQATAGVTAGGVPWMQAIDENTDLPLAVAMAKGTFATAIKVYANLPGDLVAKITAEAHRQHMLVWAHSAVFPATPREVIDAGVDVVSHVCYMAYQATPAMPASYQQRVPIDPAPFMKGNNKVMAGLFDALVKRNIILDVTGRVYLDDAARFAAHPSRQPPLCPVPLAVALTRQAWRAGVEMSTGTDGTTPWNDPWPAVYDERIFQADMVGIPRARVIRSATLMGARAAGQEADMGTVVPGKLANMIVLTKNPLDDIANVKSIELTIKRGREYPRADFRPISHDELPGE